MLSKTTELKQSSKRTKKLGFRELPKKADLPSFEARVLRVTENTGESSRKPISRYLITFCGKRKACLEMGCSKGKKGKLA